MHRSYFTQNRKERSKLASDRARARWDTYHAELPPMDPWDRPDLCREVIVIVYEGPEPQSFKYVLRARNKRVDSYWVYRDGKALPDDSMGFSEAMRRISKHVPKVLGIRAIRER